MYRTCYSCQVLKKLESLTHFLNAQIPNFMKMYPMGPKLFHKDVQRQRQTDEGTDMTKLIVAFHNFANVPKTE